MRLGGVLASLAALLMLLGRPAAGKDIIDMEFCGEDDCYKVGADGQGCVFVVCFCFFLLVSSCGGWQQWDGGGTRCLETLERLGARLAAPYYACIARIIVLDG
jgi:hypothetical protein